MLKPLPLFLVFLLALAAVSSGFAQTRNLGSYSNQAFFRRTQIGTTYIVHNPLPRPYYASNVSARMIAAASFAEAAAERRSTLRCWRYVKRALVKSKAVSSYPQTVYAKQAARELQSSYGFRRLPVRNPFDAPIGSVLVYGGRGAGHVEIRTPHGYVSDYASRRPCSLPFIGAYAQTK